MLLLLSFSSSNRAHEHLLTSESRRNNHMLAVEASGITRWWSVSWCLECLSVSIYSVLSHSSLAASSFSGVSVSASVIPVCLLVYAFGLLVNCRTLFCTPAFLRPWQYAVVLRSTKYFFIFIYLYFLFTDRFSSVLIMCKNTLLVLYVSNVSICIETIWLRHKNKYGNLVRLLENRVAFFH